MYDMEEVENMIEQEKKIINAGYLDSKHFEESKLYAEKGMIKYGTLFVKALGSALERADRDNALKIMRYWNALCETHATLYKMYLAKRKSVESE